jgi:hypothetical protein
MPDFSALRADAFPVDVELVDAGCTGPELAYLAGVYLRSPRALVWRNPSSDWRLFVLLLPIASRLSLMANPIFAQLARAWGLNARFVGIDRQGLVHDFRSLLSDRTLRLLVDALHADIGEAPDGNRLLDTLFAALATEMLTVLERRRDDWRRHLDTEHRLEPRAPASLFDREARHPDFLAALRAALRDGLIDIAFYGRALRATDLREQAVEQRLASLIESALDPIVLGRVAATSAGRHLGCYNWLMLDPRHAAARAHVLSRLPGLAAFFAQTLVPLDAQPLPGGPQGFDLRSVAARAASAHSQHWAGVLRRAIDAGQDRAVIEALAQRFAVPENILRRLWRELPAGFGQPPGWQIGPVLRELARAGERDWPADAAAWQTLLARAVPIEAA